MTWGQRAARAGRVEGLSLERMEALTSVLGDPQSCYPVIHVTGTNGKGSVARMVTRLLMAHELSVGTYTSPHLERYNERLRVNDEDVSDDVFASAIATVARVEELLEETPSHFEVLTAAAFAHFADVAVHVAVVEVGLLGRYDATNVARGEVAVITNIGRDHTDFAGDWRRRIAEEKAGIIKPGSHLVLGETDPALRDVFVAEGPALTWDRGPDFACTANELAVGGRLVTLRTPFHTIEDVFVPLHGRHQGDNAAVALAAVEAFFGRPVDPGVIHEAFAAVRNPGRFEVLGRNPLLILDGAHNPDGAEAAGAVLTEGFDIEGRRTLVVGMLDGRDHVAMLDGLGVANFDRVLCCAPDSPRALPAVDLAALVTKAGVVAEVVPAVSDAVTRAVRGADPGDLVVVTGSLYTAGEARPVLRALAARPRAGRSDG
jgi:dihydrofolate synthase/folylpolyglutamate synthase